MHNKTAADVMTAKVVTIRADALLIDAIRLLLEHRISGLPVVDADRKMVGIITEHDFMNFAFSGDAADTKVEEAMCRKVVSFTTTTDIATLVNAFAEKRIKRVPIVDDHGCLVGVVSRRDILREMLAMYGRF